MIALITVASSGIGKDMAYYLNKLGYDLILVARNEEKLNKLKQELNSRSDNVEIIVSDLSKQQECIKLYEKVKEKYNDIDILINNAGFGLYGEILDTDIEKEMMMIDTNIKAVHILTKLFLKDMVEKDKGRILNVASIASFMAGPLMATYYGTKNYILRFSQAIKEELYVRNSKVKISVLCPGPVTTNFNTVAGIENDLNGLESQYVSKVAIDNMLKNKFLIIPGLKIKIAIFFIKILPDSLISKICYKIQKKKDIEQ